MYKRVLLKLSGEALKEKNKDQIIDAVAMDKFAAVINNLHQQGFEIAVVIGAGNIWRGKLAKDIGIEPAPADFMGMLGTVINAVALSSSLKKYNVESVVYSAIPEIPEITKAYVPEEAKRDLANKKVVFLSGGTGKPFYTTDTAATMRALELDCDAIFMGKNGVQGVYDKDPTKYEDAKFIKTITYQEMLDKKLQIMDISAVELIKDANIEIRVFSMSDPQNFIRVANGEDLGTTCKKGE